MYHLRASMNIINGLIAQAKVQTHRMHRWQAAHLQAGAWSPPLGEQKSKAKRQSDSTPT